MDATIEGGDIIIAFNVRYLERVLDVIQTQNVALETSKSTSPGVLRPVGDDNFLHVIMPMHLGRLTDYITGFHFIKKSRLLLENRDSIFLRLAGAFINVTEDFLMTLIVKSG